MVSTPLNAAANRYSPEGLRVSAGAYPDLSYKYKFGFNGAVGTTEETIWDQGGLYTWPSSASTVTISSDSVDDASAGTGASTVYIEGLDASYLEQSEVLTLNGQTAVTSTGTYLRVNRMVVRSAGSGETNAGVVYVGTGTVTAGVPANVWARISAGEAQTLMAVWTVPASKTAYFSKLVVSSFGNANTEVTVRLRARPNGEVFQTKDKFLITRGIAPYALDIPTPFAEKTDLHVTGTAGSGTIDLSAAMELYVNE